MYRRPRSSHADALRAGTSVAADLLGLGSPSARSSRGPRPGQVRNAPGNEELEFWRAIALASAGQRAEARQILLPLPRAGP